MRLGANQPKRSRAIESITAGAARKALRLGLVIASLNLILGCGGGGGAGTARSPDSDLISVSITPSSTSVSDGQSVQLTATVTGTTNTTVNWLVDGISGGSAAVGTISSSGLYTASPSGPSRVVTIGAVSAADSTASATASVAVVASGQVASTNNPQVAEYSISPPRDAQVMVEFGPDTSYGLKTWSVATPTGGGQVNILVAGMRAYTTYHLRAVVQFQDNTQVLDGDHAFATGGLPPSRVPNVTISVPKTSPAGEGVESLDLIGGATNQVVAAVVDLNGNLIWYYDAPYQAGATLNPIKFLSDGTVLVNYNQGPQDGDNSILTKIDLAGNTIWQITGLNLGAKLAAAGYSFNVNGSHHDFALLPNGHIVLIVGITKDFTNLPGYPGTTTVVGDLLVDLDTNLNPVWVWSSFDHLDVNRHPLFFPDWLHSNAVLYSPTDGNLILSMRHQDWVIKIAYEDGSGDGHIIWKLGYQGDFTLQNGTDPIDWFYAQHAPILLSSESSGVFKLGLFDNGNNRVLDSNGDICGVPGYAACTSRVPIFQIDETHMTAQPVWQDDLSPTFSFFGGYVQELPNQNVEFDVCAYSSNPLAATVEEVTQDSPPQVVYQMTINGQYAYRAFRIPSLYPGVQW